MNVLDFFKRDVPIKPILYPSGQIGAVLNVDNEDADESFSEEEEPPDNTDYADEFIKKDELEYKERLLSVQDEEGEMSRLECTSPIPSCSALETVENTPGIESVYSKYNFTQESKPDLVMTSYEETIIDLSNSEKVLIIQGPTGCGKTTQVPQFILDHYKRNNKYCKIAVTQPRKIAAITVARRVSQERGWPLGTVVGYKVSLEGQVSEDTLITYMTTGVLLQQLVNAKNMNMYTHIILDEVHERDQEMDFLLLIVKKFYRQQSQTRLILMSATIDTEQFSKYFAKKLISQGDHDSEEAAPVLDIVKPNQYLVNVYHLDQLIQLVDNRTELIYDIKKAQLNFALFSLVESLLNAFDRTDGADSETPGSVLIFLPGIFEIEELYELLSKDDRTGKIQWLILPLHSSITVEEQKRAFEEPPEGHRKIILSTNIAESSVTVPDVVYVIDFCLTKILVTDSLTNYSHLELSWASRSNCIQRAGRVGRCRSGRVYRLVYTDFFENEMSERIEPEILRCPLHRLVLLAKLLDMGPPHGILALAMDRPNLTQIRNTVIALKEAGALHLTTSRKNTRTDEEEIVWDDRDGDLTTVGYIMSKLPLDIYGSRLIIFGHIFGVLRESVIMAAAMSVQNIFSNPFNQRMRSYNTKLIWANGSFSDLNAYLNVYFVWEKNKYSNVNFNNAALNKTTKNEKQWMQQNFLQPKIMREWNILVQDINTRLQRCGVLPTYVNTTSGVITDYERAMLIKVIISAAFYPNYFIRSSEGGQPDEAAAVKTLGCRDPYTTVYFTGKPTDQPGQLYVSKIKNLLKDVAYDMHVSFDAGQSGKIYVQFRSTEQDDNLLGKIPTEMYRAVKFRQLNIPAEVKTVSAEEGRRRLQAWREKEKIINCRFNKRMMSILPGPEVENIELRVTYANSPHNFYAHNMDLDFQKLVSHISFILNNQTLNIVRNVSVGEIYAAPYQRSYFRARAVYVYPTGPDGQPDVKIYYMDYGNTENVAMSQLREVPSDVRQYPELAIKCTLAHVEPSLGHAEWTKDARTFFESRIEEKDLFAVIYSVVDGVCALELYEQRSQDNKTLNEILVEQGYAQRYIESFLSQDDHARRMQTQGRDVEEAALINATNSAIEAHPWNRGQNEQNIPPPPAHECRFTMRLKGPHSPLEMQVYSAVKCGSHRSVNVEWNSVNSVLLDSHPQDVHDRLLVAGTVSTSAETGKLTLRHTTMMPNLRGFPALMALLFGPRAVMHTNKTDSRITSVLCGLGCDENYRPRYDAHDMSFNLDFEFGPDDLLMINEIREYMNILMETVKCADSNQPTTHATETCQAEIQNRIRQLLRVPREPLPREQLPHTLSWRHAVTKTAYSTSLKDIWPKHNIPRIKREPKKIEKENVERHLETMHDMATNMVPMTEITCQLCNIKLYELYEMRIHLVSEQHKRNTERLASNQES